MPFDCLDPPPITPDPPPLVSPSSLSRGPKRIEIHGIWYDKFPDGSLEYCKECNKGKLPLPGTVVTQEEHQAIIKAGITVPAVTVQPFRSTNNGYDPDHQCNNCGASQYVVSGYNGQGHTHTCSRCGNIWWH